MTNVAAVSAEREGVGPRGRSAPPGITLMALAGFLLINVVILGYAVYVARPATTHEAAPAPEIAAVGAEAAAAPQEPPSAASDRMVTVATPIILPDEAVVKGKYIQHCSACHGAGGRGDGPAAAQLFPPPRNLVDSPFRFASLSGGEEELIAGLERTISRGVPRSPMPGFGGVLSEQMIAGLARYVLNLGSADLIAITLGRVDVGTRPPTTPELIARGKKLYTAAGCVTCHGESGHGDGEQARTLLDSTGRPVAPADLTSGLFKSGQGPEDQARVILKGVLGTPMPAYEDALVKINRDDSRDLTDIWALVAYVRSFQTRPETPAIPSGARLGAVPAPDAEMLFDAGHVAWLGVEPTSLELKPLWQRSESITHVDVRLVRTANKLAICLDWRDGTMDVVRDHQTFPDAVAVMFGLGDAVPALPMGVRIEGHEPEAPVNIWHWQANRQLYAVEGLAHALRTQPGRANPPWRVFPLVDERSTIASEHDIDVQIPLTFLTARLAGNVHENIRLLTYPVLESNAEGFGTLTLQPAEQQDVRGVSLWSNGMWRVVMVRDLEADDPADVRLIDRVRIPVTFAVWDGAKKDRDGMKLITSWHWLMVGPWPGARSDADGAAEDSLTSEEAQ